MIGRILKSTIVVYIVTVILMPAHGHTLEYSTGQVLDFMTKKPIKGAFVTLDRDVILTDENGMFVTKSQSNRVAVRAHGYVRAEQPIGTQVVNAPLQIHLMPFEPKALYLSFFGIGSRKLRESALKLIEETEINALVIDVKGDRGNIVFRSSIPLATEIGAQKIIPVKDMRGLIKSLRDRGIYTIARIVVFKDNPLASAKTELAVKSRNGLVWRDKENLAWTDPSLKKVWDYNISIAVEAAEYGFDEIQFDYMRFPDAAGLKFSIPNTQENRLNAITGFLMQARKALIPYNVFLAADIFGYVCWNINDTLIGQKLEDLIPYLDYISPMLYPSGFRYGIPGFRNPVASPYEIVYFSLERARTRTHLSAIRFRPWLQAFRDYAFDRRFFTGQEIRKQIDAAEKFGAKGWMLWNPHNVYSGDGLKYKKGPAAAPDTHNTGKVDKRT